MRVLKSRVLTALVLGALAPPVVAQEAAARRHLELDDFGAVRQPESLRVSPDGSRLSYVFDDRLYLVTGNGPPLAVTAEAHGVQDSRWAADGKSIYFLCERDAMTQLYRLPIDGPGEAVQVSHFERRVASLNLSPDETRVLMAISDDELRDPPVEPAPIVVTRHHFKRDAGHGYITDGTLNHLYVYDIATRTMRQVTSGPWDDGQAAWAPDGRRVVFASNRQPDPDRDYRTDLFIVDVDAAGGEPGLRRLTDDAHTKSSPAWSPDGRQIAYLSAEDGLYAINRIAVIPAGGGEPRFLTADFDRSISSFSYTPDGEWVWFDYPDSGTVRLGRVRVDDGRVETLVDGERVVVAFDIGASGAVALVLQEGVGAGDVYRLKGTTAVKLTDLNREFFDAVELGHKTKVRVQSGAQTSMDTFITTPPGYGDRRAYPAVLLIHGGPVSQFAWGYDFRAQYFASRGYVVIEPNPRGSYGRGQAFIRAIYRTWGLPDYDDLMAAVDHAVAKGIADPSRLFVTGYSYGGYMTNVIITQTDRFKAAVSGAGHSLIEANVGHDMYSQWYYWELGPPWQHRERYDLLSPLLRAGDVVTPTLFYGGRVDWNVPVLNAELFYQALRDRGVDTELVVYPDMYHSGWSDSFEQDRLKRTVDWFDRYLGGK